MSQHRRAQYVAAGIAAAVIAGFLFFPRPAPFPDGQVATAPAPTPTAPTAPAAEPTPVPTPAPVRPVGPESLEDAAVRLRWEERLARQDEHLVAQAMGAGCDADRAEAMRKALSEARAARARTIEELRSGKIDDAGLAVQARENKRRTDEALRAILNPAELHALDPVGARAQVIEEEN